MDLRQALMSTGAVRQFSSAEVSDEVLFRVLDAARFAPSGGNRQAWRVVVVKEPSARRRLRDLYLTGWYEYLAMGAAGLVPWSPLNDRAAERDAKAHAPEMRERSQASGGFAEQLDQAPALLVLLADLGSLAAVDRDHDRYTLVGGASVYPFAWSVLLAAHAEGLGGVLTTMLCREEQAVLDLLGAPADRYALAGALVLGYPAGRRPTRLRRDPVGSFATIDRVDGAPLTSG